MQPRGAPSGAESHLGSFPKLRPPAMYECGRKAGEVVPPFPLSLEEGKE